MGTKFTSLLLDDGEGVKVTWVITVVGNGKSRSMDVDKSPRADVAMVTMELAADRVDVSIKNISESELGGGCEREPEREVGVTDDRGVVLCKSEGSGVGKILTSVVIGRLASEEVGVAVSSSGTALLEERGSRNSGTLDVNRSTDDWVSVELVGVVSDGVERGRLGNVVGEETPPDCNDVIGNKTSVVSTIRKSLVSLASVKT